MARKSLEQRLAEIEDARRKIKARLAKSERAKDTRRKILIGALVLHRLEHSKDAEFTRRLSDWLGRELPEFLTREKDLELFEELLPNRQEKGQERGQEMEVKTE